MIRIGIVGAENSHSWSIAKTLNVTKAVAGAQVVAIWGETDEYAKNAAEKGQIPTIVKKPTDMIGRIDAVIVDHRHAKLHLPAALPFLDERLPLFIDKPFCYRLAEGKAFLAKARKLRVPVTSFSSMPAQKAFGKLLQAVKKAGDVRAVSSIGPADIMSQWGGIFFYGIHQVDMLIEGFGQDIAAVSVTKKKAGEKFLATVTLFWDSGLMATMQCLTGGETGFHMAVSTDKGVIAERIVSDADPYLAGIKRFVKMFKDGKEPYSHSRILAPVAVLEAMEKAVTSGKLEKVAKV
jgi:predicted dehydrogenase